MTPDEFKQKAINMVATGWGLHYSHQVLLWVLTEKDGEGIPWKETHIDHDGVETVTTTPKQNLFKVFKECDALELRERFYKMSEHPKIRKETDDWLLSACIVYRMKNSDKFIAQLFAEKGIPSDES
jgi:hypothetical protein